MKKRKSRVAARKPHTTTSIGGVTRKVVSPTEWRRARAAMTAREKKHMRAMDTLAAARRRMPWMKVDKDYAFEGPQGRASLPDLFDGRSQLVLYHFMFGPKVEGWPEKGCVGCSFVADQISHLDHIHARDITFAMVSVAPLADIRGLRERFGWTQWPWYSGTAQFARDLDVSDESGNSFGLNVLLRDGEDVYRTHFVARRGLEAFGTAWSFFDVVPFGRQEDWQDAPAGTPQGAPYQWWRRHGEYDADAVGRKG
jgi:predicted dithiol-disulfide oxidoreductase (DUF899 family)